MAGPVSQNGRRLVVTELHGLLNTTMRGLVATPGMGIGGKALQLGRPAAVNDYMHSTAVSHHIGRKVALEHIHGALAVPARVGHAVKAVLYGLARTTDPLGDRVLDAAAAVAAAGGRELAVGSRWPVACGRSTPNGCAVKNAGSASSCRRSTRSCAPSPPTHPISAFASASWRCATAWFRARVDRPPAADRTRTSGARGRRGRQDQHRGRRRAVDHADDGQDLSQERDAQARCA